MSDVILWLGDSQLCMLYYYASTVRGNSSQSMICYDFFFWYLETHRSQITSPTWEDSSKPTNTISSWVQAERIPEIQEKGNQNKL